MIEVRRIGAHEAALLREVRLAALLDSPESFESLHDEAQRLDPTVWRQRAARDSAGTDYTVFVAVQEQAGVGMVGAFPPDGRADERHIWGMWVAPASRRRGIGRRLLDTVVEWTWDTGARTATLWVVESNTAAVSLYQRYGFRPTGERKPLGSNPALVEVKLALNRFS